MIYLIALCALGFGLCRELSEHGKENAFKGYSDWWNTGTSHRNKHEWGYRLGLPKWVFKNVLVWTTDAEHFFQMMSFLFVLGAVYLLGGLQLSLAFYIGHIFVGVLKTFTKLK